MGMTKEQEMWMNMVRAHQLKDKVDNLYKEFERVSATSDFLTLCIALVYSGVSDLPIHLLYQWRFQYAEKILDISKELDAIQTEVKTLRPTV